MSQAPRQREGAHPTPITYVKVAAALVTITAIEVGIFYVESLESIIIPAFLVLSAVKFALVIMFYMHLRFDSRLFSGFFVGGLLLAVAVIVALMALFEVLLERPSPVHATEEIKEMIVTTADDLTEKTAEELFVAKACNVCHAIEGLSEGTIGPELNTIATVAATRKSGLSAEEYIRESIEKPIDFVVDGYDPIMPPTIRDTLTDEELEVLVAFLLTLN